ncbi:hypothetical protein GM3708_2674 [Geminocystis sp. NIES-3708]|uniref:PilW family protein n=1 Tax=Geminocystis sp. NIES-3708 TaxID=1615909 RepID=UPI0005FCBA8F|nr:hypothetical protein [Geminocystis sp. NIES-3708]BAQ62268.1 hypothetical protein GM3708_2674 [Geminocystis sp. NIES-3708]
MTTISKVVANISETTSLCGGMTLIDLLVGIAMGSIVLTAAASGFINLLTLNQDIDSKTVRRAGLIKSLAYIQDEIKGAKYVTATPATSGGHCSLSSVDSDYCLVLTYPDGALEAEECTANEPKIYYGFQDISKGNQIWLKPGILKRKIICNDGKQRNWIVIADGLLSKKENNPVSDFTTYDDFCRQNSVNWTKSSKVYGGDIKDQKGGFRFCLHEDENGKSHSENRLVRVFLYGHIINGNPISVSTVVFTRSQ